MNKDQSDFNDTVKEQEQDTGEVRLYISSPDDQLEVEENIRLELTIIFTAAIMLIVAIIVAILFCLRHK